MIKNKEESTYSVFQAPFLPTYSVFQAPLLPTYSDFQAPFLPTCSDLMQKNHQPFWQLKSLDFKERMNSFARRFMQNKPPERDEWRSCFFATTQKSFNTSKNETKNQRSTSINLVKFSPL